MNTYARWAIAVARGRHRRRRRLRTSSRLAAARSEARRLQRPTDSLARSIQVSRADHPTADRSALAEPLHPFERRRRLPRTYVSQFDPPMTFTIAHEVEHDCAPDFQMPWQHRCRTCLGAVDLEFGVPRIEALIMRVDKLNDPVPRRAADRPAPPISRMDRRAGPIDGRRPDIRQRSAVSPRLSLERSPSSDGRAYQIPAMANVDIGFAPYVSIRLFAAGRPRRQVSSRERGRHARRELRPSSSTPAARTGRQSPPQSGNASGPRSCSSRASPEASSAGSHEYG